MIKNILLVEDDRGTTLLAKNHLKSKGYLVHTAINGLEALKILASYPIDLIITDVVMPEMDGVDLYEAVKKDPLTSSIPVIISTDKKVFKESFATLGVSNFIEKTSNLDILVEKINYVEHDVEKIKRFSKILVTGNQPIALERMEVALNGVQYLAATARTSSEIMAKALAMVPKAIFIDVLFQDSIPSHELIKALRCFNSVANTKIITYSFFIPEDIGLDAATVEKLETAINLCSKAGSGEYMGRFVQKSFLQKINNMGI